MNDINSDKGRQVVELKNLYENLRKKFGSYELYNLMEKCLIEVQLNANDKKLYSDLNLEHVLIRHIRGLAM